MQLVPAPRARRAHRVAPLPFTHLSPLRDTALERSLEPIELTGGNPVDPVPQFIQDAFVAAANAHAYPTPASAEAVRHAAAGYLERALGVSADTDAVLAQAGTKGLLTSLPQHLDLGPEHLIAMPAVAYTSYVAGAHLVGATAVLLEADEDIDALDRLATPPALIYLVSPGNPTATIVRPDALRRVVTWARRHGAVVVSDEAYLAFDWTGEARSILHPDVAGNSHEGLLAVHSLSKHSNLAGYRSGFVAGDPALVADLTALQAHLATLSVPINAAAAVAWTDDAHVEEQRQRYIRRRDVLLAALRSAGFELDDPEGGLYLWARLPGADDLQAAHRLAELGIITVPGRYYRADGGAEPHVRISLTAPDETIAEAARRLEGHSPAR